MKISQLWDLIETWDFSRGPPPGTPDLNDYDGQDDNNTNNNISKDNIPFRNHKLDLILMMMMIITMTTVTTTSTTAATSTRTTRRKTEGIESTS